MPTTPTSIHFGYQPDLDPFWGIREFISNGIDGEMRNRHLNRGKLTVDYSRRTQTLILRNEGITVSKNAMLMGTSESREAESCIGQFGEGFPIGCLAVKRDPTMHVTVFNGDEKWEPLIQRVPAYGSEPVLVFKTRKLRKDRGAFEVHVTGVSRDMCTELLHSFLRFDPHFDKTKSIKAGFGDRTAEVLLQERYHGKIYNKGVFVMKRDDLLFGYNLHAELNRDRQVMDEFDLRGKLTETLRDAVRVDSTGFLPTLVKNIFGEGGEQSLEVRDEYSALYWDEGVCDAVTAKFVEKYGDDAIGIQYDSEAEKAEKLGLRPIKVNGLLARILKSKLGTVDSIEAERLKQVRNLWTESDLQPHERAFYKRSLLMVRAVLDEARDLKFMVAAFGSPEIRWQNQKNEEGEVLGILVSRRELSDQVSAVRTVAQAASAQSESADEAEVLAKVISKLLTSEDNYSLSMELLSCEGI